MKREMKSLIIMSALLLLTLLGCGTHIVYPRFNSNPYSYNFREVDCSTGDHEFNSREDMCSSLRDSGFNNYCASRERARFFDSQGCPGRYVEY